jgi:hypothetical protein
MDKGLSLDVVQSFVVRTSFVEPIEKILAKLKSRDYRDCDAKWLYGRLGRFIEAVAVTLDINPALILESENDKAEVMSEVQYNYFTENFEILLEHFKKYV